MTSNEELASIRQRMEERLCNVESPNGPQGIVERVYRARNGSIVVRAKVIMGTGSVRYVDIHDVYVR